MKSRSNKQSEHTKKNQELNSKHDPLLFQELQTKMESIRFLNLPQFTCEIEKLQNDLSEAIKCHPFVDKMTKTWKSIPLRSVNGLEGRRGNEGGNLNNSPDPDKYKNTRVMDVCPYIKEILDNSNVPLLKVRLMSLEPKRLLPEHTDEFNDDRIFRIHIPIITHKNVLFYVDGKSKHLEAGKMCYANVRKIHKVHNKSNITRVHLVFDVWVTDEFIVKILLPSIDQCCNDNFNNNTEKQIIPQNITQQPLKKTKLKFKRN